jgi:hypothetical protein
MQLDERRRPFILFLDSIEDGLGPQREKTRLFKNRFVDLFLYE